MSKRLVGAKPKREKQRLKALHAYEILDTFSERSFDDIVALAAHICGTPMASISLVDDARQWFKATVGSTVKQTPRDISFCQYVVASNDVMVVPNALQDDRFKNSPLVVGRSGIQFYAGVPLTTPNGLAIGALCVLDNAPRELQPSQIDALVRLSGQVMDQLELRVALRRLGDQQTELENSQETLRQFVDQAADAFFLFDANGKFISVNGEACRTLGYSRKELLQMSIGDIETKIAPGEIARNLQLLKGKRRLTIDIIQKRKDGSLFPSEVRVGKFRIHESDCFFGLSRDVSERVQTMEALRASEERFRLTCWATNDVLWELDVQTQQAWWSDNYFAQFGYDSESFRPTAELWRELIHPDDRADVLASAQEVIDNGREVWSHEYRFKRFDGTYAHLIDRAYVIRNAEGNATRMIGAAMDISDRKRAEALMRASEAAERSNRAKSEFLSRTSHELRTPLNSILGFGQLLEMYDLDDKQGECVSQILKGGRHLLGLINEVLDLSRIESGTMSLSIEPVPVENAIDESVGMVQSMASERGIEIGIHPLPPDCASVTADRQRLIQVLINLLSNAVKYNVEAGTVAVRCERAGAMVQIRISDTGPGIAAELLPRVFMPFDRLDVEQSQAVEGTGLGLAVSKSLTEAMRGHIEVESEVGKGTTFCVTLRAAEGNVLGPAQSGDLPSSVGIQERTVLYIEDNAPNVTLMEHVVRSLPRTVLHVARDGRQGLNLARSLAPDIILLDLDLPDIPGASVMESLRSDPKTATIPITVVSADASQSRKHRMLDAGARAYITKPFELRELIKHLSEFGHSQEASVA